MRLKALLFLNFLVLSFLGNFASADIYNRNLMPFGEIESFLGNSGTSGIGSTTAVYYNPATLTQILESRISASGSTYFQYSLTSDNISPGSPVPLPYRASAFQANPSSVVSTFKTEDSIWSYFVLVPESLKFDNQISWDLSTAKIDFIQTVATSDLWLGASYGRSASKDFSWGVSFFGIQHSNSQTSVVTSHRSDRPNTAATSQRYTSYSVYSGSLTVGIWNRLSEFLDFGLRVQSPFLHFSGSGKGYASATNVDNGTVTQTSQTNDSLNARYQLPLDFTLGAHLALSDSWHLYPDVSLQTPLTYNTFENSSPFSERVSSRLMLRYNLGLRYLITDSLEVLAGGYVVPSSSQDQPSNSFVFSEGTLKGVTAGTQFRSERVRTGLGLFYLWRSQPIAPALSGIPSESFETRMYGALISIGYVL